MVNDPQFRNAQWGVLIYEPATGDTLYSHNAGKLFMPASNQKILTGATALVQLGPDFRFTTRFATNGDVRNGVLNGDLIVIGRGDPSFSDAMRGDYRIAFDAMADSLNALGIHHVGGGLRRAGNAFPDDQYGFGWEFDDADEPYGAGVDELYVNEGFTKAKRRNATGDSVLTDVAIRDHPTFFLNTLHEAMRVLQVSVGFERCLIDPAGVKPEQPQIADGTIRLHRQPARFGPNTLDRIAKLGLDRALIAIQCVKSGEDNEFDVATPYRVRIGSSSAGVLVSPALREVLQCAES